MEVHRSARDARYVTKDPASALEADGGKQYVDSTPFLSWEQEDGSDDPRQRFALYRLCECEECGGRGYRELTPESMKTRCTVCRGEGRTLQLLACAELPEAAGLALVTLAREGEWEECPLGLLDRMPVCPTCGGSGQLRNWVDHSEKRDCMECHGSGVKPTGTWLILPWQPSPRNVSDAGRVLRSARRK
jgi:hypothetical protein